jgi:hypothetical protein
MILKVIKLSAGFLDSRKNQPQRSAEEKQFMKRERGQSPWNRDTASAYLCVLCGWSPGGKEKPTAEDASMKSEPESREK